MYRRAYIVHDVTNIFQYDFSGTCQSDSTCFNMFQHVLHYCLFCTFYVVCFALSCFAICFLCNLCQLFCYLFEICWHDMVFNSISVNISIKMIDIEIMYARNISSKHSLYCQKLSHFCGNF